MNINFIRPCCVLLAKRIQSEIPILLSAFSALVSPSLIVCELTLTLVEPSFHSDIFSWLNLSYRFSRFCVFFVSKANPFFFLLLFYSTVDGIAPCGGRKKSPVHHHSACYILFPLGSLSPSWLF